MVMCMIIGTDTDGAGLAGCGLSWRVLVKVLNCNFDDGILLAMQYIFLIDCKLAEDDDATP